MKVTEIMVGLRYRISGDLQNGKILLNNLKESKGNQGIAAKKLGIDRSTLWRRMKKLGLK